MRDWTTMSKTLAAGRRERVRSRKHASAPKGFCRRSASGSRSRFSLTSTGISGHGCDRKAVGPVVDPETGYIYLRNRYYDPATTQFLSRDPLDALTRSAYGYVRNNPLNGVDPSGLDGDLVPTTDGSIAITMADPNGCLAGRWANGVCTFSSKPPTTQAQTQGQWGADTGSWAYQTDPGAPMPGQPSCSQNPLTTDLGVLGIPIPPSPGSVTAFAGSEFIGLVVPILNAPLWLFGAFASLAYVIATAPNPRPGDNGIPRELQTDTNEAGIPTANGGTRFP